MKRGFFIKINWYCVIFSLEKDHKRWIIEPMERKMIGVFGSAFLKEDSAEWDKAYRFGVECAKRRYVIVCGGYGGIMEAVSRGAVENGGEVVGVLCKELKRKPNPYITEEEWCDTYPQRLAKLIDMSSVYVFFKGGIGTLTEFLLVWSMRCRDIRRDAQWFVIGNELKKKVMELKEIVNEEIDVVYVEEPEEVFKYIK